jgi:chromosome segregation ATPase
LSETIANEVTVRDAVLQILRTPNLKLTNENVIKILGGGSKQTVAPLVRRLREEFAQGGLSQDAVPPHLVSEADALVKRLYATAKDESSREHQADVMRMGRILTGLQDDCDSASAEAEVAKAEADRLQLELDAATQAIAQLTEEVANLKEAKLLLEASARTVQQDLDRANDVITSMKSQASERSMLEQRLSRIEAAMPKSAKASAYS